MAAASGVSANLSMRNSGTDTEEEEASKSANTGPSFICHVSIIANKTVSVVLWIKQETIEK